MNEYLWMSHVTALRPMRFLCSCWLWMSRVMSHIWMNHVTHSSELWHTYEWVLVNESCHCIAPNVLSLQQVDCEWVVLCHTYEWIMSHIRVSHGTHMNESCHTYEWVLVNELCHVTHVSESCHTYEWAMSHIWMSHGTHMNKSCHTYEWVLVNESCYVTHMNESCHIYEWALVNESGYVTHTDESFHTYEWGMSHVWMSSCEWVTLCHTCEWVMLCHTYEWVILSHTYEWVIHRWRGLGGNFNTQNRCFLYLQISVDLRANLWR